MYEKGDIREEYQRICSGTRIAEKVTDSESKTKAHFLELTMLRREPTVYNV